MMREVMGHVGMLAAPFTTYLVSRPFGSYPAKSNNFVLDGVNFMDHYLRPYYLPYYLALQIRLTSIRPSSPCGSRRCHW